MKKKKKKGKPGRPTLKSDGIIQVLIDALEEGMPLDRACDLAGIDRNTAYNWMQSDRVFSARVRLARAKVVQELVRDVRKKDATGHWKILRSLDPKNFGDEIRIGEMDSERDDEMAKQTDDECRKGAA